VKVGAGTEASGEAGKSGRADPLQRLFRRRAEDTLPVRIEHRRVYILPTRRGWAFLGSLSLMLVAAINYSLSLGYALCFLLTGLFSATLLHTYRNLAGLELARIEPEDAAFAGETLTFIVTLRNPTRHPRHGLRLVAASNGRGTAPSIGTEVGAGTSVRLEIAVSAERRGRRPLGRLTLASDWPLGLWKAWSYVHAPVIGTVFPTPEREPPPLPAEPDVATGAMSRGGGRGDVAGLRPYSPGDAISTIAWKSLARGQGPHVLDFEAESARSHTRLTLGATRLPDLEARLSRLAAWVLASDAAGSAYALDLPGTHLPNDRGPTQRRAALTALALYGEASDANGGTSA